VGIRPSHILLVEDSPSDQLLARAALSPSLDGSLAVVSDGVEAMEYLRNEGPFATAPRPDLILLDLNLPRKDGREVLREIKSSAEFKTIPVVILSTSTSPDDVTGAYDGRANCYVTKPGDFSEYRSALQTIRHFWLDVVRLPYAETFR
jgi:two-component system, chemotaxis family, response regulator Rcp1